MATKEQMKEEFAYFSEAWNFFKKYYEVQECDSYWDAMIEEAEKIMRKYDVPLCKAVLLAIIDEQDRKCREMIGKTDKNGPLNAARCEIKEL